ncbi:hypothetical protein SAMN05216489_07597 [Streptomyces sp. 3213]|uniref:hypothetical protein n=1 Tax=Streptomyces sp. 3213.3 TaxID=1855348 RepID=UPI0008951513|nr:hypothetical protein [Streptomyces sp. 3213.3]SEE65050.1 hypothetical protein SAMN05216489_07597 [Streptomyces sp. 3213] [Streptomyces sp. 3213.3]
MTNSGEASGVVQRALRAATPQPPQLTTHIPDCGSSSLADLGSIDQHTLNRLLSTGRPRGSGFNSSV